jgi:hypothetical protein
MDKLMKRLLIYGRPSLLTGQAFLSSSDRIHKKRSSMRSGPVTTAHKVIEVRAVDVTG